MPVDFTGFHVVSGNGAAYAGGVTASTGTSREAVYSKVVDPSASESRAQPVHLPARSWSYPWPREADALGIAAQVVVLRVVVDEARTVTSADLIGDPGYGFGAAAVACARAGQIRTGPRR